MRLVSYTRSTSSLAGQEASSKMIAEQNARIRAYASEHGWQIMKTYSDRKVDPSANSGFEQLLEDGVCRSFDAVIVDSVYRAGCDFSMGKQVLLQTFHYAGIGFIVVEDDFNSIGKSNKEAEAYYNRKEGNKRGAAIMAKKIACYDANQLTRTDIIYGYKLSDDQQAIPDPKTAPVIQRIFKLYDEGCFKQEIAQLLTKERIPIPRVHNGCAAGKDSTQWNNEYVNSILTQQRYSGHWTKDVCGAVREFRCEPIVSEALFARVQTRYQTQRECGNTSQHLFLGFMEEEERPDRTFYYRRTPKSGERYFSYSTEPTKQRLSLSVVESKLKEQLNAEKEQAQQIILRIQAEGETEKARRMEALRQELKEAADQIVVHERDKMAAYRRYQAGEISKEEWDEIYRKARAFVIGFEPMFQSYHDCVEEIETAFSDRNPWIQSRLEWNPEAPWTRKMLRRLVQKIWISKMKLKRIVLTQEEWYQILPLEWRKPYGA